MYIQNALTEFLMCLHKMSTIITYFLDLLKRISVVKHLLGEDTIDLRKA